MDTLMKTNVGRRGMLRFLGFGAAAVAVGSTAFGAPASAAESFGLSTITVRGNSSRQGWRGATVDVFVVAPDREAGKAVRRAQRNIQSGVADYVLGLSADELSRNSRSVQRGIANAVMRAAPRGAIQDVRISRVTVH